jgi:prevent-host-death family protein
MNNHIHHIGAFEAKTHLSDLLRRAEGGEEFIIQRRGRPVARLIPYRPESSEPTLQEIVSAMQEVRAQITAPVPVRELIEEGRRL